MSLDIALKAKDLVEKVNEWNEQVVAGVGGNVSANKRARSMSVDIRKEFKSLRLELLELEKKRNERY